MPQTLPANIIAPLAKTQQTPNNNADPRINIHLYYKAPPFQRWNSFRYKLIGQASGDAGASGAAASISRAVHVTTHPTVNSTDADYSYVLYTHRSKYIYTYLNALKVSGFDDYITASSVASNVGLAAAIDGHIEAGLAGNEFVTDGRPVVALVKSNQISFNYIQHNITPAHDDVPAIHQLSLSQFGTISVQAHTSMICLVCPYDDSGTAPGLYCYYYDTANNAIYGCHITSAGTIGTPVKLYDFSGTLGNFPVLNAACDPDGRVILTFDDGSSPGGNIIELRSTTDPLTFGSPVDVSAVYTQTGASSTSYLVPAWIVFYDGKIQRIAKYRFTGASLVMPQTYSSMADAEPEDYGTAVWSAWEPIQSQTPRTQLIDLQNFPDGTMRVLQYDIQDQISDPWNHRNPLNLYEGLRPSGMDLGDIIADGSVQHQNDNAISQLNLTVQNNDIVALTDDESPLRPGTMASVSLRMGNSDPVPLIAAKIDEANIDLDGDTFSISARNLTGYNLSAASFKDETTLTGSCDQMADVIFGMAQIYNYDAMHSDWSFSMTFPAHTTALEALRKIADYFTTDSHVFELQELPSGLLVFGYRTWINTNYQSTGYFDFDPSKEYKRNIRRSADAAYARVCVSGKDSSGASLTPVTLPVTGFTMWDIPDNKTLYVNAPGKMTQAQLQTYAANLAASLTRAGVTQTFRGQIKPQLLVGDVARDSTTDPPTVLGIVTSVRHNFGRTGFNTEFTIDSGGVIEAGGDVSKTRALGGYTRKQRIMDFINNATKGVT